MRAKPPEADAASNRAGGGPRRTRGHPGRVSHLAMHLKGRLPELDINPLMVLPRGQGVKAVDALVVFAAHTLHVAECL